MVRTWPHLRNCVYSNLPAARIQSRSCISCLVDNRFVRCAGFQVQHSRMKGKQVTLAHAQQLFAQDRETVLVSASKWLVFISHGVT